MRRSKQCSRDLFVITIPSLAGTRSTVWNSKRWAHLLGDPVEQCGVDHARSDVVALMFAEHVGLTPGVQRLDVYLRAVGTHAPGRWPRRALRSVVVRCSGS